MCFTAGFLIDSFLVQDLNVREYSCEIDNGSNEKFGSYTSAA
jgi:hypothetical protein